VRKSFYLYDAEYLESLKKNWKPDRMWQRRGHFLLWYDNRANES